MNFGTMPNYTTVTHSVVTVGDASTLVLADNDNRAYALLVNDSDEDMYIKIGSAAAISQGIRINANGGSYELSPALANLCGQAIYAISASGSKRLLVTEG